MKATKLLAAAAAGLLAAALTGCGGGDDEGDAGGALTVWSLENQTDRIQATQAVADRFTAATGVPVKIVATEEAQFSSQITAAAAAGTLPDLVGALPLAAVAQPTTCSTPTRPRRWSTSWAAAPSRPGPSS